MTPQEDVTGIVVIETTPNPNSESQPFRFETIYSEVSAMFTGKLARPETYSCCLRQNADFILFLSSLTPSPGVTISDYSHLLVHLAERRFRRTRATQAAHQNGA